jgi:hypothetical protein
MHGFLKPTSAVGWSITREAGGCCTDSKHEKQHKGVEGAKERAGKCSWHQYAHSKLEAIDLKLYLPSPDTDTRTKVSDTNNIHHATDQTCGYFSTLLHYTCTWLKANGMWCVKSNDVPSFPKNIPSSLVSRSKNFTELHTCSHTDKYVHNASLLTQKLMYWTT